MTQLTVVEQKLVPFGNFEILALKTSDGRIHAAVSWVSNGIKLNENQKDRQVKNIQSDLVLSKGSKKLPVKFDGQVREVLCIELDFLPLWLAKISITPTMQETNPETVENLVTYQLKAKDELAKAFLPKQQPKPLTEKEQLKASMRLSLETSEEVETLKLEVSEVKETVQNIVNTMRIDGGQEAQIRKRGNEAVMEALGGKDANAYKQLSKQVFSAFWRDFKDYFQIPRYGDLPRSRFAEGIKFISMWQPSTSIRMDITTCNGQQHLKLVEGGC